MVDTTFIIDGLHGTRAQQEQYHRTIKAIRYACASSYSKFEYCKKLGKQIRLAYKRLVREDSVADTILHVNTISSRSWGRAPAIAINVLVHVQAKIREVDPAIERRKALSLLKLQAQSLSKSFGKRSGLDLRNGSGCHYQGITATFSGSGRRRTMTLPSVECVPTNLRCTVHHHLRRSGPNKTTCNRILALLNKLEREIERAKKKAKEEGKKVDDKQGLTKEQKNFRSAVKLSRSKRGPTALADHSVCMGIGDFIIFMDALGLNNAITTNYKEWRHLDGIGGVKVIPFTGNPEDREPPPFGPK